MAAIKHRIFLAVWLSLLCLVQAPRQVEIAGASANLPISASADQPEQGSPLGDLVTVGGPDDSSTATRPELALFALANSDRAVNGLAPLALDSPALNLARARAAAQLGPGPLSHENALGQPAFADLLAKAGLTYSMAGENLARTTVGASQPVLIEQTLMSSPTHRRNILEPGFNRLAVGVAADSSGRVAFAEIFRATP